MIKVTEQRRTEGVSESVLTVEFDINDRDELASVMDKLAPILDKWESERLEYGRREKVRSGVELIVTQARHHDMDDEAKEAFSGIISFLPPDEQLAAQKQLNDAIAARNARLEAQRSTRFGRSRNQEEY